MDAFVRTTERTTEEQEAHEAFWLGYADGTDGDGASPAELGASRQVRENYIDGYRGGFLDRKKQEIGSPHDLGSSVYMASSRAVVERVGLPWWRNYTRAGA